MGYKSNLPSATWHVVEKRVKVIVLATNEREAEAVLDQGLQESFFVLDSHTIERRQAGSEDMKLVDPILEF